jgi:hypothetical protein
MTTMTDTELNEAITAALGDAGATYKLLIIFNGADTAAIWLLNQMMLEEGEKTFHYRIESWILNRHRCELWRPEGVSKKLFHVISTPCDTLARAVAEACYAALLAGKNDE